MFDLKKKKRRKLRPVEIGCSRAGNFLLALGHIKEHGLVKLRPLEVEAFLHTVRCRGKDNVRSSEWLEEGRDVFVHHRINHF